MNTSVKKFTILAATLATGFSSQAFAQGYSAADLGKTLTDFGAIQAASSDGDIPAYTGGVNAMSGLPAGGPSTSWPDPFASEKPLYTITSSNISQYQSMLTPGVQALLTRYGSKGFVVNVYPTHRTMSYPSWVLTNTLKNAQTAQMVGDGEGVTGAYGGVPFPVPTTGTQAMWDYYLSYQPALCTETHEGYDVGANGGVTDLGITINRFAEPYYDPTASALKGEFFKFYFAGQYTPPAVAGTAYLFQYPINYQQQPDTTYFYSPGTRRTRLAPEFSYDTPIASYGGAANYDEINLYKGEMNKFDFKLIGRQEMIIPYNDYGMDNNTLADLTHPGFVPPNLVRWEVHRVWVVQATLKPGERHIYAKWNFYIDEDSWKIDATESYDHSGQIYKVGLLYPWIGYGQGDATAVSIGYTITDLSNDTYFITFVYDKGQGFYSCQTALPNMLKYEAQTLSMQAPQN